MLTAKISEIHELLSKETIQVQMPGATKAEVLDKILLQVANHPSLVDFDGAESTPQPEEV